MDKNDLTTLPNMTREAVSYLWVSARVRTRAELHEYIHYAPQTVAILTNVSLHQVEQWLAELERTEPQP